jgi:histone H3/H4
MAQTKEVLTVGSKIKSVIKEHDLRSDGALVEAVSDKVHEMLAAAVERCQANKRGTVRPCDL